MFIIKSIGDIDADGFAYVETKSLDGETNLKVKKQ